MSGHFADVGKRVASVWDPADVGTVIESSHGEYVVRWDHGLETVCTSFEIEPVLEPSTLERIHAENPEIPAAEIDLALEEYGA